MFDTALRRLQAGPLWTAGCQVFTRTIPENIMLKNRLLMGQPIAGQPFLGYYPLTSSRQSCFCKLSHIEYVESKNPGSLDRSAGLFLFGVETVGNGVNRPDIDSGQICPKTRSISNYQGKRT